MKPFAVISDTHHHNFSAFSTIHGTGVNSRLQHALNDTARCVEELIKAGGDTLYHAGDLFHVRGSVAPTVLNPTLDLYASIVSRGVKVVMIPGNHDLEGKESQRVSNAVTAMERAGVEVVQFQDVIGDVVMVPWIASIVELKEALTKLAVMHPGKDCIIHAPLNGVIPGLPDHGLDPAWLATLGFKRVFVGHFHNHVAFPGNVYSVGALTHQTWSDAGSKAGFLIVTDEGVTWHKSHAPAFVDLNATTVDPADIPLIVDGNYVRVKVETSDPKEIDGLRAALEGYGAAGIVINAVRSAAATPRIGSSISAGASMEVSVADFVRSKKFANESEVLRLCNDILSSVRSAA